MSLQQRFVIHSSYIFKYRPTNLLLLDINVFNLNMLINNFKNLIVRKQKDFKVGQHQILFRKLVYSFNV